MRKKKRYVLLKTMPEKLPPSAKFLFQLERGYVLKVDLEEVNELKRHSLLISGSIKKLKQAKTLNRRKAQI